MPSFLGEVNGSATENVALLANGYQNAYGNLYSEPTDIFATPYANDIAGLLPSTTPISTIYSEGLLPSNALFSSTPPAPQYASITPATTPSDLASVFAMGFASSDYLILNSYRLSYLQDEQANPDGGFPIDDHRAACRLAQKYFAARSKDERSAQLDADHADAAVRRR